MTESLAPDSPTAPERGDAPADAVTPPSPLARSSAPTLPTLGPAGAMKGLRSLVQGDVGMVPIVVGLIALVGYFEIRSSVFLSSGNLTNLFVQASVFILLGIAEVWLLLLGDIDLSVGWVTGIGSTVVAILLDNQFHWPWWAGIVMSVLTTTVIGTVQGLIVILLRLPSFIVTLAGSFIWEGVLIFYIDRQGLGGTIPVREDVMYNIVNGNVSVAWTIILVSVTALGSCAMLIRSDRQRRTSGLETRPGWITTTKVVLSLVAALLVILVFAHNRGTFTPVRGMPYALVVVFVVLAAGSFLLSRTRPGRYLYAIGGNAEAARRSGINVNRYRLLAFVLTGVTAGVAGLVYASWLGGISDGIPAGPLVLYAVAAAVIGGTSLFGGRGKLVHAVVGGLVIAVIYNGMALIGMSPATQYIATGIVLLAAVTIDSVARRGSTAG